MPGPVQGTGQHPLTSQLVDAGGSIRALIPRTIPTPRPSLIVDQPTPPSTLGLTIDPSTPAAARSSTTTTTTAAFTPPAQSLLVAFTHGDSNDGNLTEAATVTSTGGLSWSRVVQSHAGNGGDIEIWKAQAVTSPGSITVSMTDSQGAVDKSLTVIVFIDTDPTHGTPDVGASNQTTLGASVNYTSTVANSWGWAAGLGTGAASVAVGAAETVVDSIVGGGFDGGDDIWTTKHTAITATPGTTVTSTETNTTLQHLATVEIVPTAVGGGSTVTIDATVPISATITAVGQETANAAATIATTATIAAAATEVANASAAVATTATITAAITRAANIAAPVTTTATITATAQEIANAQATVSTTATITAALSVGAAPVTIDTTEPITATIAATAAAIHPLAASRPTTAAITATMAELANAQATRPVTATITATATQTARAQTAVPVTAGIVAAVAVQAAFTPALIGIDGATTGTTLDGRSIGQTTDSAITAIGEIDTATRTMSQDNETTAAGNLG